MQLEDYFQFLASDDIRLAGSRIGIETILSAYIRKCATPEEIAQTYPTLSLEQVYATILFYHHKKDFVTAYLQDFWSWQEKIRSGEITHPNVRVLNLELRIKERRKEEQWALPS